MVLEYTDGKFYKDGKQLNPPHEGITLLDVIEKLQLCPFKLTEDWEYVTKLIFDSKQEGQKSFGIGVEYSSSWYVYRTMWALGIRKLIYLLSKAKETQLVGVDVIDDFSDQIMNVSSFKDFTAAILDFEWVKIQISAVLFAPMDLFSEYLVLEYPVFLHSVTTHKPGARYTSQLGVLIDNFKCSDAISVVRGARELLQELGVLDAFLAVAVVKSL